MAKIIHAEFDSGWQVQTLQRVVAEADVYSTLSGQLAVAKQIDVIANNIANVNTSGYKAERPLFEKALKDQSLMLTSSLKKDIRDPNPYITDDYTAMKGSYSDLSNGSIEQTGNPLDVAVNGKGFFVVTTPAGERYTRDGAFKLDATNRLVTQDGLPVQGQGGEIILRPGSLSISQDGSITVNGEPSGKLRLVSLEGAQVTREAGNLFSATGASEIEAPSVVGGALESSNVNAVRELADMILASRLFEGLKNVQDTNSKLDQQRNERLGSIQG